MKKIAIGIVALALAAVGASTALSASVRTITVTIHHSRFSMERIEVRKGERVRFLVRNEDPIDHEFIVGPMAIQLMHEYATDALHSGTSGAVSVPLFSTRSTSYRFMGRDQVLFGCHLPGHWAYGMRGIFVFDRA